MKNVRPLPRPPPSHTWRRRRRFVAAAAGSPARFSGKLSADYGAELDVLAAALTAWRRSEHHGAAGPGTGRGEGRENDGGQDGGTGRGRKSSNNGAAARCGCEPLRRIRVAATVLEAGPVLCGLCDGEFTA